jgi:hypothetical protein
MSTFMSSRAFLQCLECGGKDEQAAGKVARAKQRRVQQRWPEFKPLQSIPSVSSAPEAMTSALRGSGVSSCPCSQEPQGFGFSGEIFSAHDSRK